MSRCEKCDGAGWLWWYELDRYYGPARETGSDDTRYRCDGEVHRGNDSGNGSRKDEGPDAGTPEPSDGGGE